MDKQAYIKRLFDMVANAPKGMSVVFVVEDERGKSGGPEHQLGFTCCRTCALELLTQAGEFLCEEVVEGERPTGRPH